MRTSVFLSTCALFVVFVNVQSVFSIHLRGTVLDRRNQPVFGALVTLKEHGLTDTTDSEGRFSFVTASLRGLEPTIARTTHTIDLVNGSIVLNTSRPQQVALTLIDLRGKVIGRLFDGQMHPGRHRILLPPFSRNQTVLIDARIGSVKETVRFVGSFAHGVHFSGNSTNPTGQTVAATGNEALIVTHKLYDDETVPVVDLDDSLTVRLFRKIDCTKTMTMMPGDTFRCVGKSLSLALDSINDSRCGCDMMCAWEGNAALYFTATIDGTAYPVVLGTYDPRETTAGGYTLRLVNVTPSCPLGEPQQYQVDIAFFPTDSPAKILFLEHYITRNGVAVSGVCSHLCIDFPTYSFYDGLLRFQNIMASAPDSTRIIYGSGLSLSGDAGSGASSGLTGIASLPYTDHQVVIDSMLTDGTVFITYQEKSITILPGNSWSKESTGRETPQSDCEIDITTTDRISNFGFLMPYQILPWR